MCRHIGVQQTSSVSVAASDTAVATCPSGPHSSAVTTEVAMDDGVAPPAAAESPPARPQPLDAADAEQNPTERALRQLVVAEQDPTEQDDRKEKKRRIEKAQHCIEILLRMIAKDSDQQAVCRGGDDADVTGVEESKAEVSNVDGAKDWAARMDQVEHVLQNPPDSNAPLSRIKEELCALSAWLESGCRVLLVLLYAPDLDLAGEAKNIINAGNHAPRHVAFVVCRAINFRCIKRVLQSCSASDPFDLVMFSGHGKRPDKLGNQRFQMCTSRLFLQAKPSQRLLIRCLCLVS